jgi:hypothetical protein
MELEYFRQIFEKKHSNITKLRPVEADLFHAAGQTDTHEANNQFSQLCSSA